MLRCLEVHCLLAGSLQDQVQDLRASSALGRRCGQRRGWRLVQDLKLKNVNWPLLRARLRLSLVRLKLGLHVQLSLLLHLRLLLQARLELRAALLQRLSSTARPVISLEASNWSMERQIGSRSFKKLVTMIRKTGKGSHGSPRADRPPSYLDQDQAAET